MVGELGTGKLFSTKLQFWGGGDVRRDNLLMIVRMDGVEAGNEVSTASISGSMRHAGSTRWTCNRPDEVLQDIPDFNPWSDQIAWAITFFETFFTNVATESPDVRKQTLRRPVQEAYERKYTPGSVDPRQRVAQYET